jgi:hypothetical protein
MNLAFENVNAKVTITDHDSRIIRFNYQSANDGEFFAEHMFLIMEIIPSYYNHYNGLAFSTSSFNLLIPHYPPAPLSSPSGNFLTDLFE